MSCQFYLFSVTLRNISDRAHARKLFSDVFGTIADACSRNSVRDYSTCKINGRETIRDCSSCAARTFEEL